LPDGVETVAPYAFSKNKTLKRVTLPDGLKEVCEYAFSDVAVEEFSFPKSIAHVAYHGFFGCGKLTTIYFRGKKSEYHLKQDSSWTFSLNDKRECPQMKTTDGMAWSV
ncbi:MAG: leucine-rich repeat protein, partial [Clostridia bacterium]|nr:leucine-rich repeat protein [Clostridia bacterium]